MSLMDSFIAAHGAPIEHDDRKLHWTYRFPVETGDILQLRFLEFALDPVQGLAMDGENCTLLVGGHSAEKFQIWTDTAPEVVRCSVQKAGAGAHIALFNVWSDATHTPMLYRLNNAAMAPEVRSSGEVLLRCSDGLGPLTLDDLVVEVMRLRPSS